MRCEAKCKDKKQTLHYRHIHYVYHIQNLRTYKGVRSNISSFAQGGINMLL